MKNSDMKTQEETTLTTYSNRIVSTQYSTKVTPTGGRHGRIRSEDGLLHMKLALPRQRGGRGDATSPEQLFAGGYAASCIQLSSFFRLSVVGLTPSRIRIRRQIL